MVKKMTWMGTWIVTHRGSTNRGIPARDTQFRLWSNAWAPDHNVILVTCVHHGVKVGVIVGGVGIIGMVAGGGHRLAKGIGRCWRRGPCVGPHPQH